MVQQTGLIRGGFAKRIAQARTKADGTRRIGAVQASEKFLAKAEKKGVLTDVQFSEKFREKAREEGIDIEGKVRQIRREAQRRRERIEEAKALGFSEKFAQLAESRGLSIPSRAIISRKELLRQEDFRQQKNRQAIQNVIDSIEKASIKKPETKDESFKNILLKTISRGSERLLAARQAVLERKPQFFKSREPITLLERETIRQATLGVIALPTFVLTIARQILTPIKTTKGGIESIKLVGAELKRKQVPTTIKVLAKEFKVDPVGTLVSFRAYGKSLNILGRGIKATPVGAFAARELFLATRIPKEIRPIVRKILTAADVQRKLFPTEIRNIRRVDFSKIKSLTKFEARTFLKTVRDTNSVVYGSAAARFLGGKRLPIPKDLDVATANKNLFIKRFLDNLPRSSRKNYFIRGGKIIRKSNGQAIVDLKLLSGEGRVLIPERSILTRKGLLPVIGFVREIKISKGKILPVIKRKPRFGTFEVPTEKLVKVKGIRFTGFGEQTLRKALGTLEVIIGKNKRRSKDPQGLLIALEVQKRALQFKRIKFPLSKIFRKRKIRILNDAINLLKSKEFRKLIEKKVPGLTKKYPLVSRINTKNLKKILPLKAKRVAKQSFNKLARKEILALKTEEQKISFPEIKIKKAKSSRLRKIEKPSRLPPSRLPSSKLRPTKLPISPSVSNFINQPSKIPGLGKSFLRIPPSITPPSKIPPSKIPPSKVPSTILPPSRVPPSKLPPSRLPPLKKVPPKIPPFKPVKIPKKTQIKKVKKILQSKHIKKQFIYIPDLYSAVYGIRASKKERKELLRPGRIFTGVGIRRLV